MNDVTEPAVPTGFLLLPAAGERTTEVLRRKVRLLALRRLLTWNPTTLHGPAAKQLGKVQAVLAQAVRRAAAPVLDAVGNPDVLNPLLCLEAGVGDPTALIEAAIPPLLAGLAVHRGRGAVPEMLLWEAPLSRLVDVRHGQLLTFDPPAKALLVDPSGMEFMLADGAKRELPDPPGAIEPHPHLTVSRPFFPLTAHPRQHLSLVDTNPLAMNEEHPDKEGNALSLGDYDSDHWLDALNQAIELIRIALPDWYAEMRASQERIIPVGFEPERHFSATYREAPGLLYLTLHPDPITIAEAIVHETQHTKVNLLSWVDPVLHNAWTTWTESPVRPDLRPLWGVLLAVHAFVPVAVLHQRLAAMDHPLTQKGRFAERRAEVLAGNARGLSILLDKGEPTQDGRRILDDMRDIQAAMEAVAPPPPRPIAEDVMPPG